MMIQWQECDPYEAVATFGEPPGEVVVQVYQGLEGKLELNYECRCAACQLVSDMGLELFMGDDPQEGFHYLEFFAEKYGDEVDMGLRYTSEGGQLMACDICGKVVVMPMDIQPPLSRTPLGTFFLCGNPRCKSEVTRRVKEDN